MSENELIDLNQVRKVAYQDPEFTMEILNISMQEIPKITEEIRKALKIKDAEASKQAIHKIKPTFYTLGTIHYGDLAKKVQNHLSNGGELEVVIGEIEEIIAIEPVIIEEIREKLTILRGN
ncbi:Hpt domain-containing protein [Marinigracilibium pacificum]|uniref:Hpt domain-containing protein n=1 Tax=Marinigracilibium pacificum TaxID=2729599 RepID=A0A848J6E1_9BACT|nr:Hpt domain-containing protein [Marinigracilibium pacificum]NMM50034.1 Hpt domain-containing protein [Marinigracilibium pacificum]